jgi:tetratricopeptide (TPR) repeat protein
MSGKECFIVMPIKKDATEDYRHFKTLYEDWIKPIPESQGYKVVRADDIQRSGLITREVISALARADLVVADLTDLNPNVFYELGVRHALRGHGTIMLLDESRTQDVPFDLSPYRVIKFSSDMFGLGVLRKRLASYIEGIPSEATIETARDNPVHDSIPELPIDSLSSSTGSEEGKLRVQLTDAHRTLREYERQYGLLDQDREVESAGTRIHTLLQQVREGSFGPDLAKSAHAAAGQQDKETYLNVLQRIVQDNTVRLDSRAYVTLVSDASSLGLNEAVSIVFDVAKRVHPNDDDIRSSELAHLAHSYDPAERRRARDEISRYLGIQVEASSIDVPDGLTEKQLSLCGLMLDAYHEDNMNQEALRVTEALLAKLPDSTAVVRNRARALERMDRSEEALEWFQRAIWCPNADDISAVWFGSELHNRRRYVDALEAYTLACVLDPDDATGFAHVCDEISRAIDERDELDYEIPGVDSTRRILPDQIDTSTLQQALLAAFSCAFLDQSDIDRCVAAANRNGIDTELIALMLSVRAGNHIEINDHTIGQLRLIERRRFAVEIRKILESSLTKKASNSIAKPS